MNGTHKDPRTGRKNNTGRLAVGQIWQVKAKRLDPYLDFWYGDKLILMGLPDPTRYNDVRVSCFGLEHYVPSWEILTHCKLIG